MPGPTELMILAGVMAALAIVGVVAWLVVRGGKGRR
jgi:hypothetical protein